MPKTDEKLLKHPMAQPIHLAFTRFEGRADLESPEHDLLVCNVPVQFDPVELVFEVHLPASHDLVQELLHHPSSKLNLINVVLDRSRSGMRLEARYVKGLSLKKLLTEYQKVLNFLGSSAADLPTRCVSLWPDESKITFDAPQLLSAAHPIRLITAMHAGTCSFLPI